MKPRILLLSTAYLPLVGGSELAIRHIAERSPGYEFDLVTRRDPAGAPTVQQMDRVRVFRVRAPKPLLPVAVFLKSLTLTFRNRYALVHAYQASHAAGAAWLLKLVRPGLPLVVTLQEGKDLDRQPLLLRAARRLILRGADRITAISSHLAAYARHEAPGVPVDLIPNGVSIRDIFDPPRNPDPTVLTVSRLVPKNNIAGVIRAFAEIREAVPNARLLVAGDGPLRMELESLARELGVREAVQFMGTVPHDDLPAVYAAADVFVRPSLSEGLGSVFLEAMAAGVPVVASSVGGIPDIVQHEQTGLLADPHDDAAVARAVVRLLTDHALRDRITATAGTMVRGQYDWTAVASRMSAVYEQMSHA